jgi:succinate dehydrogenase / fumarate reductase flavoprotein subunit
MQGLADGYFILPNTVCDYLVGTRPGEVRAGDPAFREVEAAVDARTKKLLAVRGKRTVDSFHRELGELLWNDCGMARKDAGLRSALARVPQLREEFWKDVTVPGSGAELNQSLEKAGRVADFFELAELLCLDALHRTESCGAHFREESQTPDGEAKRDDANFAYVAAWEYAGEGKPPVLHKEPLEFEEVHFAQRSYK